MYVTIPAYYLPYSYIARWGDSLMKSELVEEFLFLMNYHSRRRSKQMLELLELV